MRRPFVRRCGLVLAALALPVLMIGTAASATTPSAAKLSSATLNGDGSTFQLGFNQVVIGSFKPVQKAVTINYQGNGSGAGRTDFVNGVVDFAGTDAAYKATDPQPPKPFLYFPTVVAPITVSYNLAGVSKLKLSPDTIGKIFSAAITICVTARFLSHLHMYASETDSLAGADGFEPLHIRIGIRQDSSPGSGTRTCASL